MSPRAEKDYFTRVADIAERVRAGEQPVSIPLLIARLTVLEEEVADLKRKVDPPVTQSEPPCADCGCQAEQHCCLSEAGECLNTRCPTNCQRYVRMEVVGATRG